MDKWYWSVAWSVAMNNSIAIICWTFLAYHFDKWWIALFGGLFLTIVERRKEDDEV